MSLTERLRKCAEIAGSGDALARKTAIPRRTLEYYISGESEPKADRLMAIVKATGVNGHWLLTGEGPMLLADVGHASEAAPMLVDAARLGMAIAAVEQALVDRNLSIKPEKRAKLAALIYQEFMRDKAQGEAAAYLSQLMELVSNN